MITDADDGAEESTADDVRRDWRELDLENDVWLVERDGTPAGIGGVLKRADDRVASEASVDPAHRGRGLGTALLELIEARAQELAPGGRLTNDVFATNSAANALLERRGYKPARHFFRMVIELVQPPPAPQWPAALEPRPFELEHAEQFHEASEDAFAEEWGHTGRTFEDFLEHRVNAPGASTDLWLAVWDGDEIAAALTCEARRYEMGWVGSIGVRKAWRRRGLGLALLHHAFGEFWRRGERTVGLGVDAENPTGATRLYERAGMHVAHAFVVYEKSLPV